VFLRPSLRQPIVVFCFADSDLNTVSTRLATRDVVSIRIRFESSDTAIPHQVTLSPSSIKMALEEKAETDNLAEKLAGAVTVGSVYLS
jgi:hypothetical protein